MTLFWIVAALLLAAALLFLLPALLRRKASRPAVGASGANVAVYRDQLREAERDLAADLITRERFEQTRAEIERRVLEDTAATASTPVAEARPSRTTAIVLALLIPVASVATYLALGRPDALSPQAGAGSSHEVTPAQIQQMVDALAERLKSEPDNIEGWVMLGRSYAAMSRYGDAAAALRKAVALRPGDADLMADLADMLGMSQDRRLSGEPMQLIQQALAANPQHVKALALAGSAAFEAQDWAGARAHWERALAVVPADSEIARSLRDSLAETSRRAGGDPAAAPAAAAAPVAPSAAAAAPAAPSAAAGAERLSGEVALDPQLASRVAAGDTLFVYARAADGPRVPLAIVRRQASELPYRFSLDDTMAMAPAFRLSGARQVVVEARVSKSGQATPQSGDLVGQVGPVAPGTQGLRVVIDRLQP